MLLLLFYKQLCYTAIMLKWYDKRVTLLKKTVNFFFKCTHVFKALINVKLQYRCTMNFVQNLGLLARLTFNQIKLKKRTLTMQIYANVCSSYTPSS